MSWQVETLHYGNQRVPGAQVFHQAGWDTWQDFSFYVFLLTGPDGVALVDCGMDDPGPLNEAITTSLGEQGCIGHVPTGGTITELLGRRGLSHEDVDLVALTHLHADHAGNVASFPRAQVAIGRRGWEQHLRRRESHPGLVAPPAFPQDALDHLDHLDRRGDLLLADDGDEVVPGIGLRTIGGHTDDSTAVVVDSEVGRLVFPGDTIWTYENLERDIPVGSHVDVPTCLDAMAWARGAGDLVVPSHDPLVLQRLGGAR